MPLSPFDAESDETVMRQLEINLHAVIFGMKDAIRRMRPRREGHVINLASSAGKIGFPNGATYCATKFGVVGVSDAVRRELRGSGIEISIILPGVVKTELATGLRTPRGIRAVSAEEVGAAILDTLQRPRFEVYVPRNIGPILAIISALPRPARDVIARLLAADRALTEADVTERASYEKRAAASAPTIDNDSEVKR